MYRSLLLCAGPMLAPPRRRHSSAAFRSAANTSSSFPTPKFTPSRSTAASATASSNARLTSARVTATARPVPRPAFRNTTSRSATGRTTRVLSDGSAVSIRGLYPFNIARMRALRSDVRRPPSTACAYEELTEVKRITADNKTDNILVIRGPLAYILRF